MNVLKNASYLPELMRIGFENEHDSIVLEIKNGEFGVPYVKLECWATIKRCGTPEMVISELNNSLSQGTKISIFDDYPVQIGELPTYTHVDNRGFNHLLYYRPETVQFADFIVETHNPFNRKVLRVWFQLGSVTVEYGLLSPVTKTFTNEDDFATFLKEFREKELFDLV